MVAKKKAPKPVPIKGVKGHTRPKSVKGVKPKFSGGKPPRTY